MERTYRVGTRWFPLIFLELVFGLGLVFALLGSVILLHKLILNTPSAKTINLESGLILLPIGALLGYTAWTGLFRHPWSVEIGRTGVVSVRSVLWTHRFQTSQLLSLDRGHDRKAETGPDDRELTIVHSGGKCRVRWFAEIESLISDLCGLNPAVSVRGTWTSASRTYFRRPGSG